MAVAAHHSDGSPEPLYKRAGVDKQGARDGLARLFDSLRSTWTHRGNVELDLGHFANVVDLGPISVAISTDGVGTKTIVAQLMDSYVGVGIDCVAINVNDVLCVGAEPQALVDYLAVHHTDPDMMAEIGEGLNEGARQARIAIVGGETAQLPEVLKGEQGANGFDLAGTCIGTLAPGTAITGSRVRPRDAIIGLRSSGIHCNGLTLARSVFGLAEEADAGDKRASLSRHHDELGCALGKELLRPARVYVSDVLGMLRSEIDIRGLAHISGDGLLNLPRLDADVGYVIDDLPGPQPIFGLIQTRGDVPDEEMYEVFNMGIGFCVVVPEADADEAVEIASGNGTESQVIGHTVADQSRTVTITQPGLRGRRGEGFKRS